MALFLAVGILRAWHHEPWRDECGVWLLAHNCHSLGDLLPNLRYGGHPYLWPILAWLLAHATTQIFFLQLLHLLPATVAVYLVLRYAPWPRWEAALCVLGYFFFFEYAVVCRAYGIALLGAVLVAIAWQKRADRSLPGGAGLFLLTQSSVYGIILALAFIPLLGAIAWQRTRDRTLTGIWCAGWALPLLLGTALAVTMIVPPADSGFAPGWFVTFDRAHLADVVAICWRALVPIPDVNTPFPWNSNIADGFSLRVRAALGGFALGTALWCLRRNYLACLYFLLAALGLFAFSYFKLHGYLRHHGHLYLALFVAVWLTSTRMRPGFSHRAVCIRRGLFVTQAVAGIWLGTADWVKPFSANRLAAEWIAAGDFGDYILAGCEAHPASGVGMYLQRPIYYLGSQRWGTFIVWDNHDQPFSRAAEMFRSAAEFGEYNAQPVLLILNHEFPEQEGFRLEASFTDSLIADERFFLYTREPQGDDRIIETGSFLDF
ncbi:MAG: hypothetical protein ACM3U2_14575 [Deltaproteobacteria bacterium]